MFKFEQKNNTSTIGPVMGKSQINSKVKSHFAENRMTL